MILAMTGWLWHLSLGAGSFYLAYLACQKAEAIGPFAVSLILSLIGSAILFRGTKLLLICNKNRSIQSQEVPVEAVEYPNFAVWFLFSGFMKNVDFGDGISFGGSSDIGGGFDMGGGDASGSDGSS